MHRLLVLYNEPKDPTHFRKYYVGRVPTRDGVVQALIDDLIERGLNPAVPRLFIIYGSKALAKARGLKVRAAR